MTANTRTCRLLTLGCKVNQYETQYVKELLESAGFTEANEAQPADLCVVNTCTVTAEGDAKGRQLIRRLHQANPDADIVVMGCYATRDPGTVSKLPGVTQVIRDKERLVEEFQAYGVLAPLPGISRFDDHRRAFVKVQDGCLLNCSFCIIPSVRPHLRSRPARDIVAEVARLVESGYQEVVLTGIHLGHYGIDLSRGLPRNQWTRLWHLLDQLARLPGNFRIRLSSLEAAEARDDLVRALGQHPRICPHLHLCLQSGSDRILAQMKRRYRSAGFVERCHRIREALDNPAFTTDVIVGFPGETEADFEDTLRVVREVGFARLHLFSYSPRQGTPAAELHDQVPPAVKAQRRERLLALERELTNRYAHSLVGTTLDVLVQKEERELTNLTSAGSHGPALPPRPPGARQAWPGFVRGLSCRYLPVSCRGHAPALVGKRIPVRVHTVEVGDGNPTSLYLVGEPEVETSNQGSQGPQKTGPWGANGGTPPTAPCLPSLSGGAVGGVPPFENGGLAPPNPPSPLKPGEGRLPLPLRN